MMQTLPLGSLDRINFFLKLHWAAADVRPVSPLPDHRHYTRRVVLPSGKTIEVVYFEEQPDVHSRPAARCDDERARALHLCGTCGSDLVYPVEWEEHGATHWRVMLRCPDCEWTGSGIYEQALVERFDEELDRGTEALVRDLKRLMYANMEEQVDRFVAALRADHVLPEDF